MRKKKKKTTHKNDDMITLLLQVTTVEITFAFQMFCSLYINVQFEY